jgi:hypothetical protein
VDSSGYDKLGTDPPAARALTAMLRLWPFAHVILCARRFAGVLRSRHGIPCGCDIELTRTSLDGMGALPQPINNLRLWANRRDFSLLLLGANVGTCWDGLVKRRPWGWRLAVIATQVLGDLVNFFRGDLLRGGVGFCIATALLFYLLRPVVRAVFNGSILP